jgi:hypothetical protein
MSISSWSLDWTSGCVASRCAAKHKSVEVVSKPARKKDNTCATKSSSSHSVKRKQDSNNANILVVRNIWSEVMHEFEVKVPE